MMQVNVPEESKGERLDKWLAQASDGAFSRARLQALIADGQVRVNGVVITQESLKLKGGEVVEVIVPEAVDPTPQAQDIPLNIVYEDKDLIVLNKQAGLTVHPGAGQHDGTLVNALLHHCGDSLSGIGGVKRPGIVHRLDKDTSGLMLVAKNDMAHKGLSEQLADRTLSRTYHAIVWGRIAPPIGTIDRPIDRNPSDRLRQRVCPKGHGREAVTHYRTLVATDVASRVECRLQTGRTHQIRVHMQSIGHCLIGDPLYGMQLTGQKARLKPVDESVRDTVLAFHRQALHAAAIAFIHPRKDKEMSFTAAPPEDFAAVAAALGV